jgi:hypothetical protein
MGASRFSGLIGVGLLACGSSIKPPPPPLPDAAEAASPFEERRAYAELAPPPKEPQQVPAVWLHLRSPHATLAKLPTMAQTMGPIAQLKQLEVPGASPFGAAVASVIDLSQPVDLVLEQAGFAANVEPTWSFRVRSPEAVSRGRAGLTLHRVSTGVWNIGMPAASPAPELEAEPAEPDEEDPDAYLDDDVAEAPLCQLRNLPAPVGYRVICGYGAERVAAVAPFLSEAARDVGETDVRLELGGEQYQKLIDGRKRYYNFSRVAGTSSSERLGSELVERVASGLLTHDQLGASATLTGDALQGQLEMRFKADIDAPLLSEWLEQSARSSLPESCGRLPRDGVMAACFRGIGDKPVERTIEAFMASMNEELYLTSADSAELAGALSGILPPGGHLSIACGVDAQQAWSAITSPAVNAADEDERPLPAAAVASLQAALGGWCTTGIDVAPERYLAAVQRAYRTNSQRFSSKAAEENRRSVSRVRMTAVPAGLPAKTLHLVDENRPDPKYKQSKPFGAPPLLPYDLHVLVVPDGPRTWLVAARSEKLAVARARALLAPVDPKTNWPELQMFAGKPAVAFLAMDFVGIEALGMDWDSPAQRAASRELLKSVTLASHQGRLKVPFWLDVVPRQGVAGHNLRLRTEFPVLALIADLMLAAPPDQD